MENVVNFTDKMQNISIEISETKVYFNHNEKIISKFVSASAYEENKYLKVSFEFSEYDIMPGFYPLIETRNSDNDLVVTSDNWNANIINYIKEKTGLNFNSIIKYTAKLIAEDKFEITVGKIVETE